MIKNLLHTSICTVLLLAFTHSSSLADLKKPIAQNLKDLKEKLTTVTQTLTAQEGQFLTLKTLQNSLKKELATNEKQLTALEKETSKLTVLSATLQEKQVEIRKSYETSRLELRSQLANFRQKFKDIYHLTNSDNQNQLLLTAFLQDKPQAANHDFDEVYYIKKIFVKDLKIINRFKETRARMAVTDALVSDLITTLRLLESKLTNDERAANKLLLFKRWLLKLENKTKALMTKLIQDSKREKERTEKLIKQLTTGKEISGNGAATLADSTQALTSTSLASLSRGGVGVSIREGIVSDQQKLIAIKQALKGSLLPPVAGKITQQFGKNRVGALNTVFISKGVAYSCSEGEQAKAVSAGTVKYSGVIPGIGDTVVLMHEVDLSSDKQHLNNSGSNAATVSDTEPNSTNTTSKLQLYTLYGRLKELNVKVGDTLTAGQAIGELEWKDDGAQFYFEVRINGVAVDPSGMY